MRRSILILALVTACSKGPEQDLQYIKQARSLAAEWALVNDRYARGDLTRTYVDSMHYWLAEDIRTASSALTRPDEPYAREIRALMSEPPNASPERLRAHADALRTFESSLESD